MIVLGGIKMFDYYIKFLSTFDKSSANLVKKHIVAFFVSLLTLLLSFFMIYHLLNTQKDDAYLINKSGKQRMNCQKSEFMALLFSTSKSELSNVEELKNISKEVENTFLELSLHLKSIDFIQFDDLKNSLTHQSNLLDKLIKSNFSDKITLSIYLKNSDLLINYFDLATKSLEEHSQAKLSQTKNIVLILLLSLLIILVVEANFIFRPAIVESAKRSKELNELNKTLEKRVAYEIEENRKKEFILIQKTKQAEIGELINSIAHQWKNPLSIMGLYLEDTRYEIANGCEKMDIDRVHHRLFLIYSLHYPPLCMY